MQRKQQKNCNKYVFIYHFYFTNNVVNLHTLVEKIKWVFIEIALL